MSFILNAILSVLEKFAELILAGGITILNVLFGGVETVINGILALLPTLPETVAPPEYIQDINWFFPVGTVASVATGLLVSYGTFLGVRWILVKTGMLGG